MAGSGQKFIGRNRAPRVQIEYDVETGGAQKAVELPFIMNVMSDLKGELQDGEEAVAIEDRSFDEVDISTFGDYLAETKPRARFTVPNKLSDESESMQVDLTFTSMADFTPGRIAEQVAPLKELLDARNELKSLLTFMDGRQSAEKAVKELLNNETLMKSLAASRPGTEEGEGE